MPTSRRRRSTRTSPRSACARCTAGITRGRDPSGTPAAWRGRASADELQMGRRVRVVATRRQRNRHALEHVREELTPALNPEVAIQGRHVLMDGGGADAETRGDLLLAVAFQQAGERLTKPWRELLDARLGGTHERATNQPTDLRVKELEEALLAR